jgi:hypothetical protein
MKNLSRKNESVCISAGIVEGEQMAANLSIEKVLPLQGELFAIPDGARTRWLNNPPASLTLPF